MTSIAPASQVTHVAAVAAVAAVAPLKFIVNSELRIEHDGTTDSHFYYYIPLPSVAYTQVSVIAASIPKTYYAVDVGNKMTLVEGAASVDISMPEGNYSIIAFRNTLQDLLTAASPNGYIYNITANLLQKVTKVDTGKFTFRVQMPPGATQPQLVLYDTLYEQIGFDGNRAYTFVNNSLTCPNVYNMNRVGALFIHSSICASATGNILQEIYTSGSETNSFINYENKCPTVGCPISPLVTHGERVFYFTLADEHNNFINLNGVRFIFTLLFQ